MAISPRIAVYTAIIDGYDSTLPEIQKREDSVDYICFTDSDMQGDGIWQVRKVNRHFADPQRDARRIKLLPHVFLPEYDISLWIDGNVLIKNYSVSDMLCHLGSANIVGVRHNERDCIYQEAGAVLGYGIEDPRLVRQQIARYKARGFPEHFGLSCTCFQLRKHSDPKCRLFFEMWWEEVSRYSKRDQLSFDYVRWATREQTLILPVNLLENDIFRWGTISDGRHSGSKFKYQKYWSVPGALYGEAPPETTEARSESRAATPVGQPSSLGGYIAKLKDSGFSIGLGKNSIVIKNADVTIRGEADNTLWTTYGVFCEKSYAFSAKGDFVVFDIGMNIGTASLFYAGYDNVKAIHAFEPFLPTYKQAMINFELNQKISGKITPYSYGLGAENKQLSIHYDKSLPGSMSTVVDRFEKAPDLEAVEIKNAAEALEPLFALHKEKILLKIDCEGAEGEILSTLAKGKLLKRVSAIALEWHFKPPAYLSRLLVKNGFTLFSSHAIPDKLGMIYAVNTALE